MPDESRMQQWEAVVNAIARLGGQAEQTKIIPNVEVLDDSPADLPANYVIVESEQGYHIPAIVISGLAVHTGDLVNLLYVEGTEAIVLSQGAGSSSGTGGWPYDKVLTVDPTNANADYTTITLAAAGAVANDCILVGNTATYAEANITLPMDTSLVFFDNYFVQLVNTTNVHTLILTGNTIHRLNVYANLSNANPVYALECGDTYTILNECMIRADNTNANDATADAYAVYTADGEVSMRDCQVIATCSCATAHAYSVAIKGGELYDCYCSGGARGYGLYVYADGDVNVYGGHLSGTRGGLYVEAGATVRLCNLPRIEGGVTNLGTIEGMWIDENGDLCYEGSAKGSLIAGKDATHAMDLLAVGTDGKVLTADAASALGVKWDGQATGLVTTAHTHAKLVASDGAPDPALSADAAGNLTAVAALSLAGQFTHSTYVVRAVKVVTGIADNTATTVFTITTTDEAGATDGGGYACKVHALIGHAVASGAGTLAVKDFGAAFAHVISGAAAANTGAVTEIHETASAANNAVVRDIGAVTMTCVDTSAYQVDVQFTIDITGTSAPTSTAQVVAMIELTWYGFLTAPVIS